MKKAIVGARTVKTAHNKSYISLFINYGVSDAERLGYIDARKEGDRLFFFVTPEGERAINEAELEERLKNRASGKKNRKFARERDSVMRDMGLTKIKGAVSGSTYWE